MLLIEDQNFLFDIFREFHYLAPFTVLLLCGVGLPLPEEVTLIGSGILVHRYPDEVGFWQITAVCSFAILLGDSVPYWLGRRYGVAALRVKWVRRILHPERFARVQARFEEHGNWATFLFRFFAGIRVPGYFIAGVMGMRYTRFLLLDFLGVLISVPISIYLGMLFGSSMDELQSKVHDFHLLLGFLALSLVLILLVRSRRQARVPAAPPSRLDEETRPDPPAEG
jgi:membrane protein DedA with SNARE-associated domain